MSVNAIQRPVAITGVFDVARLKRESDRSRATGSQAGRFTVVYPASTNKGDHGFDQGDLVFQIGDSRGYKHERYSAHDKHKAKLNQQPPVSCNLRGAQISNDVLERMKADPMDPDKLLQRAMREEMTVLGFCKVACDYDDRVENQKDIPILLAGTIDHCAQYNTKAGSMLIWDAPLPSRKQMVGSRVVKKRSQKIVPDILPIEMNCRIELIQLVEWAKKSKCNITAGEATFVDQLKAFVKKNGAEFWSLEGEFLYNMYKAQVEAETLQAYADVFQANEVENLLCFDRWAKIIYTGIVLHGQPRRVLFQHYNTAVNIELFGQIKPLLDCMTRLVGRCTRGAAQGGYMDVLIEMM